MPTNPIDDRLNKRLQTLSAPKTPAFGKASALAAARKKAKRGSERLPTFKVGRITYSGNNEIACVIRDYADTGARIVLEGEAALPEDVCLSIAQAGVRRIAKVIWQHDREAGLSFGVDTQQSGQ
ncbi:MAG: hypothetical protein R3C42_03925 [Parvularculaceae bacterium]|nr:PilZ domain-containing protein [Parvularculaceae bacterium]